MAYEIEYKFEELPLLTVDGAQGALINGSACIDVLAENEWAISEIWVWAYKDGQRTSIRVSNIVGTSEGFLYLSILRELTEGSFARHIQDRVDDWYEDWRDSRGDRH